jgi:hypothetical protein
MTEKSVDELISDLWHFNSAPSSNPDGREVVSSKLRECTDVLVTSGAADAVPSTSEASTKTKCQHGKRLSLCKDCGGEYLCEHGRVKRQCKYCGGASICIHRRRISLCKECGGSALCEHRRQKRQCKLCEVQTGPCSCSRTSFEFNRDQQVCAIMARENNFVANALVVDCAITESKSTFAKNAAEKV